MNASEIVTSTADPAFAADRMGGIIAWNCAAERLLGHRASEVVGKKCFDVVCGRDVFCNCYCGESCPVIAKTRSRQPIRHCRLSVRTASSEAIEVRMFVLVVPDGSGPESAIVHIFEPLERGRADAASAGASETGRELGGLPPALAVLVAPAGRPGHEPTERELSERRARLRALATELSLAEERERRRIARGLHDQVGHPLAFARQRLGELRESGSPEEMLRALDKVEELLLQAIEETRSLSFELGSPVLYELGLEAGLESLCRRLAERDGLRFEFASDRRPKPLARDTEVVLYRVAEELLANVVKHARARVARVAVERVGDEVHIAIEDDGVGIAAEEAPEPRGLGLFSIRERLDHLGGRLEIDGGRRSGATRSGATRSGTRIVAVAPLEFERSAAGESP